MLVVLFTSQQETKDKVDAVFSFGRIVYVEWNLSLVLEGSKDMKGMFCIIKPLMHDYILRYSSGCNGRALYRFASYPTMVTPPIRYGKTVAD